MIEEDLKKLMDLAWEHRWWCGVPGDEEEVNGLVIGTKEFVKEVTDNTPWRKFDVFSPPKPTKEEMDQ